MYCKHCGQALHQEQAICLHCGVPKGKGNSYCANCGQPTNELAVICIHCGMQLKELEAPTVANNSTPVKKTKGIQNLSFIPKFILSALAILFCFIDGFFFYTSMWNGEYEYGNPSTFDYLLSRAFDAEYAILIPIFILIAISLIASFIGMFKGKKSLGWVGFGFSIAAFLFVAIVSIVAQNNFSFFKSSSFTIYGYEYPYITAQYFENFGFVFYLELLVSALSTVISLLEGLGKPLFKLKKKSEDIVI